MKTLFQSVITTRRIIPVLCDVSNLEYVPPIVKHHYFAKHSTMTAAAVRIPLFKKASSLYGKGRNNGEFASRKDGKLGYR